jgi:hypothetical protein
MDHQAGVEGPGVGVVVDGDLGADELAVADRVGVEEVAGDVFAPPGS